MISGIHKKGRKRLTLEEVEEPLHGLLVILVLLALDDNLLQSVNELLPSLLGEGIVKELLGLFDGVVELFSVLLGDSVLELLSLSSGLVLGRSVLVGLRLGRASLLVGSASDLVLLLSERGVGVSRVVEVLSVRLQGFLGLALVLLLLLLELLLLLLSLVVCLASGSRVALSVDDPVCQWCSSEGRKRVTYLASRGSSLGLYRI
jgi:hypothetical protein